MKARYLVIGYLVGAFLTFGHLFDTIPPHQLSGGYLDTASRDLGSALGGAVWPIYWGGKLSLEAVRAVRSTKLRLSCSG